MTLKRSLLPLVAALALGAAGCGGDDDNDKADTAAPAETVATESAPAAGGGSDELSLSADPAKIAFDTKDLSAQAGKVTISMANPSSTPHAIAVEGNGVDQDGKVVTKGGTSTISADLKPGNYTFYCPVGDHEAEGMKGTLTVK